MTETTCVTIRWMGHACYLVEADGYTLALDPYGDGSVPGLPPLRLQADDVLCSHGHGDHAAGALVSRTGRGVCPFTVTPLETWHDDRRGALRGPNTMTLLEVGGLRLAHLGDLGCMPEEAQLRVLTALDAVMIPVGGHYTLPPRLCRVLLERIRPKVILPMHYRGEDFGYPVLGTLQNFLQPGDPVRRYETDTLRLTPDTPPQIAVLRPGR